MAAFETPALGALPAPAPVPVPPRVRVMFGTDVELTQRVAAGLAATVMELTDERAPALPSISALVHVLRCALQIVAAKDPHMAQEIRAILTRVFGADAEGADIVGTFVAH